MSQLHPAGGIGSRSTPAHPFASPARRALVTLGVSLSLVMGSLMVALTVRSADHVGTVNLGTATGFAVLAGSAITNIPDSAINGDVGLSPTTGAAITGLTCLEVTGDIYKVDEAGNPCFEEDQDHVDGAKLDLTAAYIDAAGRPDATVIDTELGGASLAGGVYKSAAGTFGITGQLTLNGQGSSDTVWIFQTLAGTGTLITAENSSVSLINGADACNVFWQVGASATLAGNSHLAGTVMAHQSITVQSSAAGGAVVDGRVLARDAAVTLDKATINVSVCPTADPTAPPTNGPTAPPTNGPTAPPTNGPTAPPTNGPTAPPANGPTAPPANGPTAPPTNGPTAPPATPTPVPAGELPDTATALPAWAPTGPGLAMLLLLVGFLAVAVVLLIRPPFDPRARARAVAGPAATPTILAVATAIPAAAPIATPALAPAGRRPDTATAVPASVPNGPGLAMLLLLVGFLAAAIVLLIRPLFAPRARARRRRPSG